ncbi:hypothetical protein MIND_01007200 [Mycena indigotica]|uniref:Uncharacterized protein n=1 Tax=Mycena indigotica TaxID=2126181 RepID=A0A8H6SBA0_9AGAR|nr:uncharacterized protein MIND_01007200 [Mycena indigotica]KAF7294700.1 hypothetical protein MIND_01007200 [Mycena indigotica]
MNVGEPFHLASYPISRHKKSPKRQHLFATHEKVASEGYVTTTVQGDGVHVLDLSTVHPVISHTLGPSTSFSCPSISVVESQQNVCRTYAVIASSADVELDACGRTIWVWKEDTSSTEPSSQTKKVAVMPHSIFNIFSPSPKAILFSSPTGDWTLADQDLNIRDARLPLATTSTVLHSFVFPSAFLSAYSGCTTIVSLEATKEGLTNIRVLVVKGETEVAECGVCALPILSDQIVATSCSASGFLTIITKDGSWNSFQLEQTSDAIGVYEAAQPIRLKSLSFIGNEDDQEICLVALNTSLVFLAAIASSSRTIVLLIWDLQYSVLLASQSFAIPSTLSGLTSISIAIQLTKSTSPQALLIVSPPLSDSAPPKSTRSSIFAVPLTFPKSSTLSNAMGRASMDNQWLEVPKSEETPQTKIVQQIQQAFAKKDSVKAETAFFAWANEKESDSAFGHSLLSDILTAVLHTSGAYSHRIVKFLLEKRVVSASMVDGGLLTALKHHNDWNAIQVCTQTVLDISESDLVFVLREVIRTSSDPNAMEVDLLGTAPSLPVFLDSCVRYRTSPTALRIALHEYLTQAEEVLPVLEILDKWVVHWKTAQVVVMPSKKSIHKDTFGASVLVDEWRHEREDPGHPPLLKVLSFLQTLLDASFLLLLQHQPAHAVLRRVSEHIEPELRLTEQVDALRGPLEVFARAQAKAVREAKEKQNGKEADNWRERRRLVHERTGMAVGALYQLEELVL